MTSELKQQLTQIFYAQSITQGLDPIVIKNLKILPLVCFPQAKECELTFTENEIKVVLIPFSGIQGMIKRLWHRRFNDIYTKNLNMSFNYWLQCIKKKPNIVIEWKKNE